MTFNVSVRQHGSIFKQVTVDDRAAVKTLAEGFRMEFNLPIIFVGPCTFLPTGDAIFIEESLQICRPEPCVADGRIIAVAVPRNTPSIKRLHLDTSACLEEAFHPRQHHALAVAAEIARAQSGREHLAIHARQLALKPRLQILRRHFGPLLLPPGISSSICHGKSCPSDQETGLIGRNQRDW